MNVLVNESTISPTMTMGRRGVVPFLVMLVALLLFHKVDADVHIPLLEYSEVIKAKDDSANLYTPAANRDRILDLVRRSSVRLFHNCLHQSYNKSSCLYSHVAWTRVRSWI